MAGRDGWGGWRDGWAEERRGRDCPMCRLDGTAGDGSGVRFLEGEFLDGYLSRTGSIPGYAVAVWKGGHVAEPTDLDGRAATGYWMEVLRLGRAVEVLYRPAKMNYLTLGNSVPHLHTHVVPRPLHDPRPHEPLPWRYLGEGHQDDDRLRRDAAELRRLLREPGDLHR